MSLEVEGTVVISTVSAPERPELLWPWLALDWTSDWESVGWIDEPVGPWRTSQEHDDVPPRTAVG